MFGLISKDEVEYSIGRAGFFVEGVSHFKSDMSAFKGSELTSHFLKSFKHNLSILIKAQKSQRFIQYKEKIDILLIQIEQKLNEREEVVSKSLKEQIKKIEDQGIEVTYISDDFGNTAQLSPFLDNGKRLKEIIELKRLLRATIQEEVISLYNKVSTIEQSY